MVPYLLTLTDL